MKGRCGALVAGGGLGALCVCSGFVEGGSDCGMCVASG